MALSAALGGLAAATTAGFIADRMMVSAEDQRLNDALGTLALQIGPLSTEVQAREIADNEQREDSQAGIHIALLTATGDRNFVGKLVGGDTLLSTLDPPRGCSDQTLNGTAVRACTRTAGRWRGIATSDIQPRQNFRKLFVTAGLFAVALAAIAGALGSRRLAVWAVAPLSALRERISRIDPVLPDTRMLPVADDYDEVNALRAAMADLIERLLEALQQSKRFASDAAHELRTPLTTMLAELELLAEEQTVSHPALERVRKTLVGLSLRVERLLILAVPDGVDTLEREAVSITELLDDALRSRAEWGNDRVRIVCSHDGMVRGDQALLRVMLDNAIDNAVKFSPDTEVVVRVGLENDSVVIDVIDHGPGIATNDREKVFLPFYRSAQARASGTRGYGLGLALIAKIVRQHRGTVIFKEVASGAHLHIRLPTWEALT